MILAKQRPADDLPKSKILHNAKPMTVAVSIPPDMVWGIIREVIKEGLLDEPNEDDL